ncbi:hypothetical protein R3P38DRAFT_2786723 [Favolaschia claudopus]|uniref:C2H2-type domain-containing protein n=1 Tax=Favolaschia claudopus TaxID=2862362 RepID=A0AAW0AS29_9AGAR
MNHSVFALPSRDTIQPYRQDFKLIPSVSGLRFADISQNITILFGSHPNREGESDISSPEKCGHTLSLDELAADPRIDFMPETDEMGGLCLEHLSELETVKVGKVRREANIHGTNVQKGPLAGQLAWKRSSDGEAKYGPPMSISTDGDHKRRLALFILCMQNEILPGNPLYPFVCKLPGLNLRVGKNNITHDGDPKHIFKPLPTESLSRIFFHKSGFTFGLARPATQPSLNVSEAIKLLLCIVEIPKLDPEDLDLDPSEAAEFEALCLLGEAYNALLQPFINVELSLSEQIQSLITASHFFCALYVQNGTSFMSNQLYADMQSMFKNAILMVPKTRIINGELKNDWRPLSQLQYRRAARPFWRHPELTRHPPRLNMTCKRHVDHLRPSHFKRELRAKSCDLESCWAAAGMAAERILTMYGVRMNMSFSQRFQMKDTDLSRPLGGKYPAISGGIDRSMANLKTSESSTDEELIDPNTIHFANLVAGVDIDAMILSEKMSESSSVLPRSLFAEIDATGRLAHKKSILRTFFNSTTDGHTSHDRLQRVRGFTVGNKTWDRDIESAEQDVSATTHFQLGNLFTTLLCHNGTHLGLAVAKSTIIKCIAPGSKAVSVSAIPRAELHLPSSFYTFRHGLGTGTVSSRLIDCNVQDQALDISTSNLQVDLPGTRERTWSFQSSHFLAAWNSLWTILLNDPTLHDKFPIFTESLGISYASPIANTTIEESVHNRKACRICTKVVKDQDRQGHTGLGHLPLWHVWRYMRNRNQGREARFRLSFSLPLPHLIKTSRKFLPTRPCTNVPIVCAMEGCKETHWKYSFMQHMNERHPDWQHLVPSPFVEEIRITSEEQLKLGIPSHIAAEWPPPRPPPARPSTPTAEKRSASSLTLSPRRFHGRDKENYDPYDTHSFKKSRII